MKFKYLFKGLTLTTAAIAPVSILASCNKEVKVTKITISGESSVAVGNSITLTAEVSPSTAANKEVTWSVSNDEVATITQEGVLTGKVTGNVTITATAKDGSGVKATKSITVTKPIKVTDITVAKKTIPTQLEVGSSTQLILTVLPTNASNKNVTWTVTPSNIASVDSNNVLTGLAAGTATVTATAKDGSGVTGQLSITITAATTTTQTYSDYIFDRSFSISGWGTKYITYGTGWVLSDATPNDSTDYKYYIATNWHVIKGMEEVKANKYKYSCEYTSGSAIEQSDEIAFTSFEPLAQVNFTYDGKSKITIKDDEGNNVTGLQGCDIYIVLADFASCKSSASPCASVAKSKLNRLNQLTAEGKKITDLAPATTDSKHYENMNLYTGGYPASPSVKWEHHDISDEGIPLNYYSHGTSTSYENVHPCDSDTSPLMDCTPQYAYKGQYVFEDWMNGGASGSMLIADFGSGSNHIWKVAGIYWGGSGYDTEEHEYIQPYFSIFNSNWKNFAAQWM